MKCYAIMLGPIWLGFTKGEHCIGLGAALRPFRPQLQAFISAPNLVPMILFNVGRPE